MAADVLGAVALDIRGLWRVNVPDGETRSSLEQLEIRNAVAPRYAWSRKPRNVYRDLTPLAGLGQHRQAGNVVAVLVGDQDSGKGLG